MNTNQKYQQFNAQSQPTKIIPVVPHPMQHPTPDQPGYTNAVSEAMQTNAILPIYNYPRGGTPVNNRTSEEDEETQQNQTVSDKE
jgi:hypothetical protein